VLKTFRLSIVYKTFRFYGGGLVVMDVTDDDRNECPNQRWTVLFDTQSPKRPTRILRPAEFELLLEGAQWIHNQVRLKVALITGMRYKELRQLHLHPEWYDKKDNIILINETKPARKSRRRYIRLPDIGREIMGTFFSLGLRFPAHQTWHENLRKWAVNEGLSPAYLNSRTTRKTWECWLTYAFPDKRDMIVLNQGHTSETSLKHYLNIPFTEEDIVKMRYWVQGWDK